MTLTLRDVIGSVASSTDSRGILFEHEGRLHRAFSGHDAQLLDGLLNAPWLEELFDAGLVRFQRSPLILEGYDLVVEVQRVPTVSYPNEWPTVMLREAGVTIARLGTALAKHGLGLHDAHPWNVLYDATRPVWVDLGSIVRAEDVSKAWIWEFRRHIVLPLVMHRLSLHQVGDSLQRTHTGGWKRGLDGRAQRLLPVRFRALARHRHDPARFFSGLADYVEGIPARGTATAWSAYRQGRGAAVGERDRYLGKERAVDDLLASVPPGTLIDIGANAGWYSQLAVSHGHQVVAIDTDDRTLSALYLNARRDGLPILPLRMDIMWPTGSQGMGLAYRPAPERLQSDTALALAVLHHIVGRQGVTFTAFARAMSMFAKRSVIVEFIPRDDAHVSRWSVAREAWYEAEQLVAAMAPHFGHVRTLPSSPAPRVIMLFQKDAS